MVVVLLLWLCGRLPPRGKVYTELNSANIEKFVASVDAVYTKAFIDQYTNFVRGEGYLLDRKQIMDMYQLMKTLFPLVHSVTAITVSSPSSPSPSSPLLFSLASSSLDE